MTNVNETVTATLLGTFKVELTRQRKIFHTVEIDFDKLPESSKRYVIEYGLKQSLGDSHVSAENDSEAVSFIEKRLAKILEGTMGTRTSSAEPADPVEAEMVKMARNAVESKLREKGFKLRGKNADVTPDKVQELIKGYVEKHGDKLRKVAEENIKRAKALEDDEDDDILGDFVKAQQESNAGVVDAESGSDESGNADNGTGDDNGTGSDNGDESGTDGDNAEGDESEDGTPEGDDNAEQTEDGNKPRRRNRRK